MENEGSPVLNEAQTYIKSQYDILRLQATKKASLIGGSILLAICVLFLAFMVVILLAIGGTYVLAQYMPTWAAFLTMAGVFLFLIVLLILCKKALFVNPIVRGLSEHKNLNELDKEMLRAEGRATLMRELLANRAHAVQTAIDEYIRLIRLGIKLIRRFFDVQRPAN